MSLLNREQYTYFQEFIVEVENDLCNAIESNAGCFPSYGKLLSRFKEASKRLLEEGIKHVRHFVETHNELCVAVSILEEPTLERLDYEPKIKICDKRFDFHMILESRKPK